MKIYVKLDNSNNITDIESEYVLTDISGWTFLDEGEGDPYKYAKLYLPLPIFDEYGVPRYKLENGIPIERSAEEMEADRPEPQEPEPTLEEKIQGLEETVAILTECLLEMSEEVYA